MAKIELSKEEVVLINTALKADLIRIRQTIRLGLKKGLTSDESLGLFGVMKELETLQGRLEAEPK